MSKLEKVYEKAQRLIEKSKGEFDGVKLDLLQTLVSNEMDELERIKEKVTTQEIDRVASMFLPAIKKIVRDSIVDKIVGVQPVKAGLPTAIVQYIDYVYNSGDVAGKSAIDGPVTTNYSLSPGEGARIERGIDVVVRTKSTDIKSRKLLSRWTLESHEAAQFMGVNLEREITKALGAKITEEINYEIIGLLYAKASGAVAEWTKPLATDTPKVREEKAQGLFQAIEDVRHEIYNKTGRWPNYVIVNPMIASILRSTAQYVSTGNPSQPKFGRLFVQGYLEDLNMNVFVVRSLQTEDILVGWKGESELEAGVIYAPQTPFKIMDSFFNVETWEFLKSVGTSYAIAEIDYNVYGKVVVKSS